MNTYETIFWADCPANGERIVYSLTIRTAAFIKVESLVARLKQMTSAFHEDIADMLFAEFGGHQTMTAEHGGVTITTERK